MKMMNSNGEEDDCYVEAVTTAKKKKMKQAQLPFQMRGSVQSPNVIQSKKRKLTSPSVDNKSPKVVKISKKHSNKGDINKKPSKDDVNETDKDDAQLEDIETENVKENTTSNKVETKIKHETPKRTSTGHRKIEKQEKLKSRPLARFFQKADKQEDSSKEEPQNFVQEEKDKENKAKKNKKIEVKDKENKDSTKSAKSDEDVLQSTSNLNDTTEDTSAVADDSLCQSDSDIEMLSSDNEDTDEQAKSAADKEKSATDSPDALKTPKMDQTKQRKLTPKQRERMLLSAKKKEERQRLKMEKEKRLEEKRQIQQKERQEKRKKKEEREKAEKEQKQIERKLKEQKKQIEIEQKQKEKQAKEEERKKKEEERRKKEEEKLEAERKKQKAASNFTSFFVAKKQEKSVEDDSTTEVKNFMPFEVKADMKIAPVCRRTLSKQEKLLLDEKCNEGKMQVPSLYLDEIKNKKRIPGKSSKTWPLELKDDVILIDEENDGISNIVNQNIDIERQRPKLLQFSENRRPPYWGTWRKRSKHINPHKPFSKDTEWFNYEIDSDEEWEEEEPGESLHGSDDEKDDENLDDNEYDVDNEFMVPHGYLSDEEVRADEEDNEDMSPETQKFKLKVLGEQFESERNTKTAKLKPKIISYVRKGPDNKFESNVPQRIVDFLTARDVWVRQMPVILPTMSEADASATNECSTLTQLQATSGSKKTRVPEEALPDLIRLLHGNTYGKRFLMKEFMTYWHKKNEKQISKTSLVQRICEFGQWRPCPEEGPMHLKTCWYVPEKIRKEYLEEEISLPNTWSYNLIPKRKRNFSEALEKLEKEDKDKEKKNVPLITQFIKKITPEEMKMQLSVKSPSSPSQNRKSTPSTPRNKKSTSSTPQSKTVSKPSKRATLVSVARGEQFPKSTKENLLKNFVDTTEDKHTSKEDDSDDIILDDCEDDTVIDKKEKEEDKSGDKKRKDNRLDTAATECEEETLTKKKASKNIEINKDNAITESKTTKHNTTSDENVTGTADAPMIIDSD